MFLTLLKVIKLLGFKDRKELSFEDNLKHSFFVYPDEHASRAFSPPVPVPNCSWLLDILRQQAHFQCAPEIHDQEEEDRPGTRSTAQELIPDILRCTAPGRARALLSRRVSPHCDISG
jgi:hypothetical protein